MLLSPLSKARVGSLASADASPLKSPTPKSPCPPPTPQPVGPLRSSWHSQSRRGGTPCPSVSRACLLATCVLSTVALVYLVQERSQMCTADNNDLPSGGRAGWGALLPGGAGGRQVAAVVDALAGAAAPPPTTLMPKQLLPGEGPARPQRKGPRFLLYRVIGNNMPPLQCPSQLLWNTLYTLAHEAALPSCRKRWVLNRILNGTERALLLDALVAGGFGLEDILILPLNLTEVAEQPQARWGELVTAQNEARNAALDDGAAAGADWILPFDGNHFFTIEAWAAVVRSAERAEQAGHKYFKVPVHRLHKEQDPSWVRADSTFESIRPHAPIMIESQLAFHRTATERFKTGMVYGVQNKLELLARACGPSVEEVAVAAAAAAAAIAAAGKAAGAAEGQAGGAPAARGEAEAAAAAAARGARCTCSDVGKEGQPHPSNATLARECGYSLRLWFYPCPEVDPHKVFYNGLYRKRARSAAREELRKRIKRAVRDAGRPRER